MENKKKKNFWSESDPRIYGLPTSAEQKVRNILFNQMLDNIYLTSRLPYMWLKDKKGKLTQSKLRKRS